MRFCLCRSSQRWRATHREALPEPSGAQQAARVAGRRRHVPPRRGAPPVRSPGSLRRPWRCREGPPYRTYVRRAEGYAVGGAKPTSPAGRVRAAAGVRSPAGAGRRRPGREYACRPALRATQEPAPLSAVIHPPFHSRNILPRPRNGTFFLLLRQKRQSTDKQMTNIEMWIHKIGRPNNLHETGPKKVLPVDRQFWWTQPDVPSHAAPSDDRSGRPAAITWAGFSLPGSSIYLHDRYAHPKHHF